MPARQTTVAMPVESEILLEVLTSHEACLSWCPVAVEIDGAHRGRFAAGDRAEIRGSLGGRSVSFQLEILAANRDCFALRALGPFTIEASYRFGPALPEGTLVRLDVATSSPRGLAGRLGAKVVDALLGAGFMDTTLERIRDYALAAGTS
jgi:hypothetical protein